jgi:DNA polymerase III subunit gamma/tau
VAQTTLYNKWRPRTFADANDLPLVGQEAIGRTLRQAIVRNQIAHAYLFCGPRGTGKTSAARIFARAVNCQRGLQGEPCNQCGNCTALLDGRQLDLLIEIDAASNRGVDDARLLRERLLQRPGGDGLTGRYKVYIIDEVHMLTKEAFNALLKTLEEPPPSVKFVFCTTEPNKPSTRFSRALRNLPRTSSSFWRPLIHRRSCRPSFRGARGLTSGRLPLKNWWGTLSTWPRWKGLPSNRVLWRRWHGRREVD